MNWLVVTPSVRPFRPEFFEPLKELDWMIVDDTDGRVDFADLLKDRKNKPVIATEALMRAELGEVAYRMIPRHNPSCKNFGLWWAWAKGYDGAILLDDDCDTRHTPDYVNCIPVGQEVEAWAVDSASGWYNTMSQLIGNRPGFFARGYPYEYRSETMSFTRKVPVKSKFNEGLWVGTPDINGADKLQIMEEPGYNSLQVPPWQVSLTQTKAVPNTVSLRVGQKLPLSIMNVQLARELIPAFYQPPDWAVYGNFKIHRLVVVYALLVLKALMDLKGDIVTAGNPLIYHTKEGNIYREILSEHCTHLLQPYLAHLVEEAAGLLSPHTDVEYAAMAERLGLLMERLATKQRVPDRFGQILIDYAQRITQWARLCAHGPQALSRRVIPVSSKLL